VTSAKLLKEMLVPLLRLKRRNKSTNGETGWIMPIRDGFDAIFSSDPTEKESAPHIAKECDQYSANDENDPLLPGHSISSPRKSETMSAAGKDRIPLHASSMPTKPSIEFDDVSVVQRRDTEEI
jgi:hypothetical protein